MSQNTAETLTFKMTSKTHVVKNDAKGNTKDIGDVVLGTLDWGSDSFSARSGPWAQALPVGTYTVDWAHLVEGSSLNSIGDGFRFTTASTLQTSTKLKDAKGKIEKRSLTGYFVPIKADFESNRNSLGIHPDGNVYGTRGCIGLVDDDAVKFWQKVLKTTATARPKKLVVSGTPQVASDTLNISGDGAND